MADDPVGAVFLALADPTRRRLVRSLSRHPAATATGLAAELPISRQAVAKHLALLDEAGLVERERLGRETRYRLRPEPLGDAVEWLEAIGAEWDRRLAALQDHLGA